MAGTARINDPRFFVSATVAKAFVPTGSNSSCVLVSINQIINGTVQNVIVSAATDKAGEAGVLITAIFNAVDQNSVDLILTIQQDGGPNYGLTEIYF